MSGISFNSVLQLQDPAPAWRLLAHLPDLPAIPASDRLPLMPAKTAIPPVRVESASLPQFIITEETEFFGGSSDYFATTTTIGDLSMTFFETGDYDVLEYLYHWQMLVVDTDGNYGLPAVYKKPITIEALKVTGKVGKIFRLLKCWVLTVTPLEYTSASSERIICTATLKVGSPDFLRRSGDPGGDQRKGLV